MFQSFEKLAEHDRERALSEQQKRQESKHVPPAVQELEVTSEAREEMKEQSNTEPSQMDSVHLGAGEDSAPAVASVAPQAASSSSSSRGDDPAAQADQATAASTVPAQQ